MNRNHALAALIVLPGLAFLLFAALATGASATPAPSTDPMTPAELIEREPTACQAAKLAEVRAALPYDTGARWVWADIDTASGLAWPSGVIALTADLPCEYVAAVAAHEWMHSAGSHADDDHHGEERGEVVADCGVWLLLDQFPGENADFRPYAEAVGGCTDQLVSEAAAFIAGH